MDRVSRGAVRPAFSRASHPDTKRRDTLGRFPFGLDHRGPWPVGRNPRPPAPHRKGVMGSLIAAVGSLWIAVIMWDAFEAIVLPRRVTRRLRPARMFYRVTWRVWSAVARRMLPGGRRETFLSFYGPLSLLVLLAAWAASLVTAFAMVQAGIGTRLNVEGDGPLLDARAGSPPSAEELLRGFGADHEELTVLLAEWERWGAEVLESHLSYPVLSYYRSQHDNQSWLAALTTVLDASALVMVGIEGACARQAGLTFAMARHAVVDLAQVLGRPPVGSAPDRLPSSELARLRTGLAAAGVVLHAGDG